MIIDARALLLEVLEALEADPELAARARAVLVAESAPGPHAPALLDRGGLAKALGVSLASLDRLRADGLPELRLGDAPRFELAAVLAWLRARNNGPALRVLEGGR